MLHALFSCVPVSLKTVDVSSAREVLVQWSTRDAGVPTVLYGTDSKLLLKVRPTA